MGLGEGDNANQCESADLPPGFVEDDIADEPEIIANPVACSDSNVSVLSGPLDVACNIETPQLASTLQSDTAEKGSSVAHKSASRVYGVRVTDGAMTAVGLVQLLVSSCLFVAGVTMMCPENIEEGDHHFLAVLRKPSIALDAEPIVATGGLVLSSVATALIAVAGSLLAGARDRHLAPWLNSFWAPHWLAQVLSRGIVVASRGKVIALAALSCVIAYLAYKPNTMLFDGDPTLSKQLGTVSGYCMALAFIPIPKRSILLPMAGIPFDRAIYYHRLLGRFAVALGTVHGLASMYDWTARPDNVGVPVSVVLAGRLNPYCTVPPVPDLQSPSGRRLQGSQSVTYTRDSHGDQITPSLRLKRGNRGCLYNSPTQSHATGSGPSGTRWARGSFATAGLDTGNYGDFCHLTQRARSRIGVPGGSNTNWVIHVIEEDLYFDIVFSSWSDSHDGGFSYIRIPAGVLEPCDSSPCLHDGTCSDISGSYSCACEAGFAGSDCGVDIDECASSPCQNGAGCATPTTEAYMCSCVDGFTGVTCAVDNNECYSQPCEHGSCTDAIDSYSCACYIGWEGENCGVDTNECVSSPCTNGAACSDLANAYECACVMGWSGVNCAENIDECGSHPCEHGPSCIDAVNSYLCTCASGWEGNNCAEGVDECASSPCENGATCSDNVNAYECACATGWGGENCDADVDECLTLLPCEHGQCTDAGTDTYMCSCLAGWDGMNCAENIDDCASSPCYNRAVCSDSVSVYQCACEIGFAGENCEENINECYSQPCQHGHCTDAIDSYSCACDIGWEGDKCDMDIDYCLSMPCFNGADCSDGQVGYRCRCNQGWGGDNCEDNNDECQSFPCLHGSSCEDLVAAYSCDCEQGWSGSNCEANVDECTSQPCGNLTFGLCRDHIANYTCNCASGWTGYNCNTTLPIELELEISVEQFDRRAFIFDIVELLDLTSAEHIVIDSVVGGSTIVTFHLEGQGVVGAAEASYKIQELVQGAVSEGASIQLGGATVLAVDGVQPHVPADHTGCNRDALVFTAPEDNLKNIAGLVAGGAFIMILLTSHHFIRRRFYQCFYKSHVFFGLLALTGLIFHYDVGKLDVAAPWLFLMLVDYIIRAWLAVCSNGSIVAVTAVGSDCIALEVSAPSFSRRHTVAGQYCFIRLPQVSQLQWHPMTITSSPADKNLMFLIKVVGDWSGKLIANGTPTLKVGDRVSLDGPYGRLSVRLEQQREVFLVAGGIGCTPMLSVLGSLSSGSPRATLIWAVRSLSLIEHCQPLLLRAVGLGHKVVVHYTGKDDVEASLQSIRTTSVEADDGSLHVVAGRPVFSDLLRQLGAAVVDDEHGAKRLIGVLACGPQKMINELKVSCIEVEGTAGTHYDFHSEVFEW